VHWWDALWMASPTVACHVVPTTASWWNFDSRCAVRRCILSLLSARILFIKRHDTVLRKCWSFFLVNFTGGLRDVRSLTRSFSFHGPSNGCFASCHYKQVFSLCTSRHVSVLMLKAGNRALLQFARESYAELLNVFRAAFSRRRPSHVRIWLLWYTL
jgi:hypothetical protein